LGCSVDSDRGKGTPSAKDDAGVDGAAGNSDAGGDKPTGPKLDEVPALLAASYCTEILDCLDGMDETTIFGPEGCAGRVQAQAEDRGFNFTNASLMAGRLEYHPEKVEACLASIKAVGCALPTRRLFADGVCAKVFIGSADEGAPCVVTPDCSAELFCDRGAACPGTCRKRLAAASPCMDSDECAAGLECNDGGNCAAPAKRGEACGGGVAEDCATGLTCKGDDAVMGTAGVCVSFGTVFVGKLGATCNFDELVLCETGLSCVARLAGATATFTCERPVASGTTCNFGIPSPCPGAEYCNANISQGVVAGTCRMLPVAGETCVNAAGQKCAPGLVCDVDNLCHTVNRLGQPCVGNAGCASQLCVAGTCALPPTCDL
jgi:hypothetical protein